MDGRMAAYISKHAKSDYHPNGSLAANMSSSSFPFARLPPELMSAVVQCLSRGDMLRLQRASRLTHDLASKMIWSSLTFVMGWQSPPSRTPAYAQRLMQALQTLVSSDHNYAQYVRRFSLVGPPDEPGLSPNLTMFRLRFVAGSLPQQSLNIHLLTLLKRAKGLESFKINISLELSDAVWQEIARKPALTDLELVLSGRSLHAIDNRILQVIGLTSSSVSQAPKSITYRHIEKVGDLKTLKLKHICELEHLDQIASCIKKSSTTLTCFHLSFASTLFDKARKTVVAASAAAGIQNAHGPPLTMDMYDDEDDDDSLMSEDEDGWQVNGKQPVEPVDNETIRKSRVEQDAALARIFSITGGKGDRAVEKALKASAEKKAQSVSQTGGSNADEVQGLITKLLKGEKMAVEEAESLEKLRSRMDEAIRASKRAKHSKPSVPAVIAKQIVQGKHASTYGVVPGANKPNTGMSSSNSYWPYSAANQQAKYGFTPQQLSSWTNLPATLQSGKSSAPYVGTDLFDLASYSPYADEYPQLLAHAGSPQWAEHYGEAPSSSVVANHEHAVNALSKQLTFLSYEAHKPYPGGSASKQAKVDLLNKLASKSKHKAAQVAAASAPSFSSFVEAEGTTTNSASPDGTKKGPISSDDTPYEDMNIDLEHPDEINGESGDDQESADEDDSGLQAAGASKGKGKAREGQTAQSPKPAKRRSSQLTAPDESEAHSSKTEQTEQTEQTADKMMQDWIRQTHGIALEELGLFGIPAKASVLGRALQLHRLKSVILLSVGGQGPFWQMMIRAQEEAPLSLENIHTDDVSQTFVECVSKLSKVKKLFLRRRGKKDGWNTTTKAPVTIDELRRHAVQPHIKTLESLAIQNDQDGSWCFNHDMTSLVCSRARQLRELAFQCGPAQYAEFLRFSRSPSSLPKLHRLYLISSGSDKPVMFGSNGQLGAAAGPSHTAHLLPPTHPGLPMSASSSNGPGAAAGGDLHDSYHASFLLDNYAGCVQATKDWATDRMEMGAPQYFLFAVRDRSYRMVPFARIGKKPNKTAPLPWLREEYEALAARPDGDTNDSAADTAAYAARTMPFEQWEKLYRPAFAQPSKIYTGCGSFRLAEKEWQIWSYHIVNARLE